MAVRLGAGSGLLGDRIEPALDLIDQGNLDYLGLDSLGEITVADLLRRRSSDQSRGFADVGRVVRVLLPPALERGCRIVTNSGGVNALVALERAAEAVGRLGKRAKLAATVGPDAAGEPARELVARLQSDGVSLQHLDTGEPFERIADRFVGISFYLGSQAVVEALGTGAQLVVTGRHTDHSLWLAPLMHEFGWRADDYDHLAAGTIVAHLLECSSQLLGGNFTDWELVPDLENVGFPIIEVEADGTGIVTKLPEAGGFVTTATCKEQLIYEIGDPTQYLTPDVVADFTAVRFDQVGADRVRMSGSRGAPPPSTLKAILAYRDGFAADGFVSFSWPKAEAKARRAADIIRARLDRIGLKAQDVRFDLLGVNALLGPLAPPAEPAEVTLRVAVKAATEAAAAKLLGEFYPLYVAGPAGASGIVLNGPREVVAVWPALVPAEVGAARVEIREVGG